MVRKSWVVLASFATLAALLLAWACGGDGGGTQEAACNDFTDNDGDGLVDCEDPDCEQFIGCHEPGEVLCNDLVDNDDDGQTDCDDSDCQASAWCAVDHESDCTNGEDDDDDGATDCEDEDCAPHEACQPPDADADADADGDGDGDGDADADADTDEGIEECDLPCTGSPLYDTCLMGDCYESGAIRECCVAEDTTCHSVLTVGALYSGLEIDYRGFYSNDHRCTAEVLESAGHMVFSYTAQTRGAACIYGFIRVQVRGWVEELTPGTTYPLCGTGAPPNLRVNITIGEGGTDQINYTNQDCPVAGEFTLRSLGDATGEGYDFTLDGTLSELDADGRPTGETAVISIDSQGIVEVQTEG